VADRVTPEVRSRIMSRIRSKDTKPEMLVRSAAHALGYRYRLHRKDLPGKPDLTFPSRRAIVFVNGCFWHRHECDSGRRTPKTNAEFWRTKFERNVERDGRNVAELKAMGWRVMTVWECDLEDPEALDRRLIEFLG